MRFAFIVTLGCSLTVACAHAPGQRVFTYPVSYRVTRAEGVRGDTPRPAQVPSAAETQIGSDCQDNAGAPDTPYPFGRDSDCGDPNAWTAINRLPAVRIVVFDPISNSFGYVTPCLHDPSLKGKDDWDRSLDFLDRQRLALTTQKIRLLIMPYNPQDGDLTLEIHPGQGVEYELTPTHPSAPATGAETTTSKPAIPTATPSEAPKSEKTNKVLAKTENAPSETENANFSKQLDLHIQALLRGEYTSSEAFRNVTPPKTTDRPTALLTELDKTINAYRLDQVGKIQKGLLAVRATSDCFDRYLKGLSTAVTAEMARDDDHFSVAGDIPMTALLAEIKHRSCIIANHQNDTPTCDSSDKPFEEQIESLVQRLNGTRGDLNAGATMLDTLDSLFQQLDVESKPPTSKPAYTTDEWKLEKKAFKDTIKQLHDVQDQLGKSADQLQTDVNAQPKARRDLFASLNSAASQIQRFDYPPLKDGESVSFVIKRGTVDDKTTRSPGKANMIELRSAAADAMRFGLGLTVSGMRNPTFKVGPEQDTDNNGTPFKDANGNPIKKKQLLYDDRGNAEVLPAAFIHHNWLRRSPYVTPTLFERFAPTFSLGIPLAKTTDTFDQLLLGLDWELVPGVDFSVGAHFASVTRLAAGHHVGEFNPVNVDTTNLTNKQFRPALYFGIVLNKDAFTTLSGNRKQ